MNYDYDQLNKHRLAHLARTARAAHAKNQPADPRRKWGALCAKPTRQLTLDGWLARSHQDQEQDGPNSGTVRELPLPAD